MRVQLDIPKDQIRELDVLMKQAGIATKKDLFNYALTLFEWAIAEKRSGRRVASVDSTDSNFKELIMPPLERAGRVSHRSAAQNDAEMEGDLNLRRSAKA